MKESEPTVNARYVRYLTYVDNPASAALRLQRVEVSHIKGLICRTRKTLEELKREAIGKLERRGYDVRGKTPAQIRQMLRPCRMKTKSNATPLGIGISHSR
jgi:hypothetical protein